MTRILIISILIKFGNGFFGTGAASSRPEGASGTGRVSCNSISTDSNPATPRFPTRRSGSVASGSSGTVPAEVDVLIVGCGPAGLTLAAQLAAFPDIKTCIVEQKPGPLLLGQADGIACRTMEMFEAFGFSERVLKEAYWINETTFWKPDDRATARTSSAAAGCRTSKTGCRSFRTSS